MVEGRRRNDNDGNLTGGGVMKECPLHTYLLVSVEELPDGDRRGGGKRHGNGPHQ